MFWDSDLIAKIIKGIIDALRPEIAEWIKPKDRRDLTIFSFAVFFVLFVLYANKLLGL